MGNERVPLYPDKEDDEPVTASAEEIRDNIDRSHLPDSDEGQDSQRTRRQRQEQSREDVEEKAVRRMVEKLREKGKSDAFIEEHMDEIRRRVRKELSR